MNENTNPIEMQLERDIICYGGKQKKATRRI